MYMVSHKHCHSDRGGLLGAFALEVSFPIEQSRERERERERLERDGDVWV